MVDASWRPPMLAQLFSVDEHLARLGADSWTYERKLDGLRCLAVRHGDTVELWSRNHLSFTKRFPTVVAALERIDSRDFVIDGELVALIGERTSFSVLQDSASRTQPVLAAFDLLHLL
ncbi:MAG: ATP-dependent DNA ligase, partial [Actinomycetota bacterium]|nr:ATP-dependent DNA ligase [Actinomycetota bacterium]